MKTPDPPPQITPSDPRLDAERARADADNIKALQVEAEGDTASLMARYGTRLALAGVAGGSPLMGAAVSTMVGPGGTGTGPTMFSSRAA